MGGVVDVGEGGFDGSGGRVERKKSPPARDLAFEQERYEASLWPTSIMSLARYRIVALGWVAQYWSNRVTAALVFSVALDCCDPMVLSATRRVGSTALA